MEKESDLGLLPINAFDGDSAEESAIPQKEADLFGNSVRSTDACTKRSGEGRGPW